MKAKRRRLWRVLPIYAILAGACASGPDAHPGDLDAAHTRVSGDTRRRLLEHAQAIADESVEANRGSVEAQVFRDLKTKATRAQGQLEPETETVGGAPEAIKTTER